MQIVMYPRDRNRDSALEPAPGPHDGHADGEQSDSMRARSMMVFIRVLSYSLLALLLRLNLYYAMTTMPCRVVCLAMSAAM